MKTLISVGLIIILWLIFSFFLMDMNILQWNIAAKILFMFLAALSIGAAFIIDYEPK